MPISPRPLAVATSALLACSCAGASLAPVAVAAATAAATTAPVKESVVAFEGQLNGRRVQAVVLHTEAHRLRVTLSDGRKVTVAFPASEQQRLLEDARAHGVTVKVAKVEPPSHKRRDIAIGVGIVIVVIAIALGIWLLVRKRRMRAELYGPTG